MTPPGVILAPDDGGTARVTGTPGRPATTGRRSLQDSNDRLTAVMDVQHLSPATITAARRTVAARAVDTADCRQLLAMLGLADPAGPVIR